MPNDTIERGIKKAAGDANSVNYVPRKYIRRNDIAALTVLRLS